MGLEMFKLQIILINTFGFSGVWSLEILGVVQGLKGLEVSP